MHYGSLRKREREEQKTYSKKTWLKTVKLGKNIDIRSRRPKH